MFWWTVEGFTKFFFTGPLLVWITTRFVRGSRRYSSISSAVSSVSFVFLKGAAQLLKPSRNRS